MQCVCVYALHTFYEIERRIVGDAFENEEVENRVRTLEKSLGIVRASASSIESDAIQQPLSSTYSRQQHHHHHQSGSFHRRGGGGSSGGGSGGGGSGGGGSGGSGGGGSMDNGSWKTPKMKATVVISAESKKDPLLDSIKKVCISMNKLTANNYDTHAAILKTEFSKYQTDESTSTSSPSAADDAVAMAADETKVKVTKIIRKILDIVSLNKHNAGLYSRLYVDLATTFSSPAFVFPSSIFVHEMENTVQAFLTSLDEIEYVDPNTNYDGFCAYGKKNESRKAVALFILHSFEYRFHFEEADILEMIQICLDKIVAHVHIAGLPSNITTTRVNEVEEIFEIVYIFITTAYDKIASSELWTTRLFPQIQEISTYKPKEYQNVSSRAIFKVMDILDFIKKQPN